MATENKGEREKEKRRVEGVKKLLHQNVECDRSARAASGIRGEFVILLSSMLGLGFPHRFVWFWSGFLMDSPFSTLFLLLWSSGL